MTLDIELTEDGWFGGLPNSQVQTIEALLKAGQTEEQIAEFWLSQTGASTTSGFGAGGAIQKYFENVKSEFVALVCGNGKYNEEREKAKIIWQEHGKIALVSYVSFVIAQNVDLSNAALVPIIALLFSLAAKISVNAFCKTCVIENVDKPDSPNSA